MDGNKIAILFYLFNSVIPVTPGCTFHDYSVREKHLDCRQKQLVNIYGIEAYQFPTSLDLSHNEFNRLVDNVFRDAGLLSIEILNFSFNSIYHVGGFAFNGLNALKILDLSHNALTTLDLKFWPGLLMLNVSFNQLDDRASIKCFTLEILDISNNEVENLVITAETGNIKHLNISNNNIKKLPTEDFLKLPLVSLQIRGNKIRCDVTTISLLEILYAHGVDVSPTCLPLQDTNILSTSLTHNHNPSPENVPKIMPTSILGAPSPNTDYGKRLDSIEQNQTDQWNFTLIIFFTQIAIIGLLICLCVIFIIFRVRDSRKSVQTLVLPMEERDEEIPPPPYRTYASGFVI